ncbi:DUF3846 domain-containing protein [Cryobacterium roopkundense]|uniref:DUF3846 domain-containing protein n=1 Tax=Cryobacterium roopkundense TaxID=1001240 RepID=A0A7W9A0N8_9MICO|nr:DUF3846 domain-containing protein [Cryobacterium roopkundense]MBB5643651.1 hypothetical protein [Cryobacterium roopkundense]
MTSTHATALRALRIGFLHDLEETTLDPARIVEALDESVGCNNFDVVGLEDDIDLFVDDEGALNGSRLNLRATIIAHQLGTPTVLFGNAVALGCNPNTGDSISLTTTQLHRLRTALVTRPAPAIIDQLAVGLTAFPGLVAMLRRH